MQTAIRHLKRKDKTLGKTITSKSKPISFTNLPHFEALIKIIIGQQLSGKAANTIFLRVKALCPSKKVNVNTIAKLSDNELRSAGLSRPKLKTVRNIVSAIETKQLSLRKVSRMTDADAIEQLITIKGIGNWTARIFLMFVLKRLDLFPVNDGGIVKAMRKLYGENIIEEDMEHIASNWSPYRTVACWYLWQYLDNS